MSMTANINKQIEEAILDVVYNEQESRRAEITHHGLGALPVLAEHLSKDLPIEILERFESVFKDVLSGNLKGVNTGERARELALMQKRLGFLFKYKSYSIKCSSPLGYSMFIQNPNEGFSFQRHVTHKTEVFHILDVHDGGYVFICSFDDWIRAYERDSFAAWLGGRPDARYDRYRFVPRPGDVFIIDQLNVVHTVIGCILEEFATVSTDMVDRLHDQNEGKRIPSYFNRSYAQERLSFVAAPEENRLVEIGAQSPRITEIAPVRIRGGHMIPLARMALAASHYSVDPAASTDVQLDNANAASLYVLEGAGRVLIGEQHEVRSFSPPAISVSKGDLLMVPPGMYYGFINDGRERFVVSEHKIPFDVAFV